MPELTPHQRQTATAYAEVFGANEATRLVLDDLTTFAASFTDPLVSAGATRVLLYILTKRSALRREKRTT